MQNTLNQMRLDMIKMTYTAGKSGAHIGPALSMTELMAVLYLKEMNFDIQNPLDENRDRLILSKGHGVIALYAALKQVGIISEADLLTFKKNNSELSAHPTLNQKLGLEFASGSLGQGLSQGDGVALALRHKNNAKSKVFVILGDGECNEGQIWEAVMSAVQFKLQNLVIIIDKNNIQYDDFTNNVINMNPLKNKFESFGICTVEIDGHNIEAIEKALKTEHNNKPLCIIANTIKGKGISFMENDPKWHNNILTEELYNQAISELGGTI